MLLRASGLFLMFISIVGFGCPASFGPAVTVCVLDSAKKGYQCVYFPKAKSFVTFDGNRNLRCISPEESENALKACRKKQVLPVTLCAYSASDFLCTSPDGAQAHRSAESLENYVCISEQDRLRILERCH